MTKTVFNSAQDFINTVAESKAEYDAKRSRMTFEEKLKVLVKLQEKAFFLGKLSIKPWPIE